MNEQEPSEDLKAKAAVFPGEWRQKWIDIWKSSSPEDRLFWEKELDNHWKLSMQKKGYVKTYH